MPSPNPAATTDAFDASDLTTQQLVRVAGWAVFLIGCTIAVLLAIDPLRQPISRILFNLGAGLVGGVALVLAQRGRWRAGAYLLVWGVWFFVALVVIRNGGLNSPNLLNYPVLVVLTGWMLGARATLWLAGATAVLWALLFGASAQGWLPQAPESSRWAYGAYLVGILALTAASTLLARRNYLRRVYDARHVAKELIDREAQLRKLSLAVEQSPGSIVITDAQDHIEYVNEAFVQNTGYALAQVLGQRGLQVCATELDAAQRQEILHTLQAGAVWVGEQVHRRKNGVAMTESVTIAPIRQPGGEISHFVQFRQDITERKRAAEAIHRLAHFDVLTGLPNRTMLMAHLVDLQPSGVQVPATVHAVLLLDLDRFTTFNDARGSEMGDNLLCAVALRLSQHLPPEGLLVRIAGDEFAVVLHRQGSDAVQALARAQHCAAQLQAGLAKPLRLLGDAAPTQCTASIGLTLFPQSPGDRAQDALRRASTALHRAKEQGGGHLAVFGQEMGQEAEQRFRIEHDLRQAIGAGQLRLYLQSQVDGQGCVCGAEALVRWQHPSDGLVPPGVFIPLAESSDLIVLLGRWVLEQACKLLAQPTLDTRKLRLSVNLSARQFRQSDFVPELRALLARSGADPRRLTLEVTEGLVIEDFDDVVAKMRELVALGVEFALDDFGTGYSSLAYLKRLPIQEIKIDRSFVRDACTNPDDGALVQAIVSVARHFGLRVVAEGVETRAQADYLLAHEPALICQGFLFARPQPQQDWLQALDEGSAA